MAFRPYAAARAKKSLDSHSSYESFQATLEAWVLASYAAVSRSFPLDALFGLETLNGRQESRKNKSAS